MPYRYVNSGEDSARWVGFPFRDGDIVISTRSKSGTTWMQMICAVLVFGSPDLPRPLGELSAWLDLLIEPRDEVFADLEAQQHRRFVKTHTPLDGIPLDRRATYIVVARHPLDLAVSLYHHGSNIDRERFRRLTGAPEPDSPPSPRPPVREYLRDWIAADDDPRESMDSLPGVMWHLSEAWSRRQEPNVVLVHYDDLAADLDGQMRRLARRLAITVPEDRWPDLVQATTFDRMKTESDRLIPNPGIIKDSDAFFRHGRSGGGRDALTEADLAGYRARAGTRRPTGLAAPGRLRR